MKPIWYFVGLILLILGVLIFITGLYLLVSPPASKTVLAEIHPDIWWGIIMAVFGLLLFLKTRKQVVQ